MLDCAGTSSAIDASCEALRPNGQLVLLSTSWDRFSLPGLMLGVKELDILVSSMYGRAGTYLVIPNRSRPNARMALPRISA